MAALEKKQGRHRTKEKRPRTAPENRRTSDVGVGYRVEPVVLFLGDGGPAVWLFAFNSSCPSSSQASRHLHHLSWRDALIQRRALYLPALFSGTIPSNSVLFCFVWQGQT